MYELSADELKKKLLLCYMKMEKKFVHRINRLKSLNFYFKNCTRTSGTLYKIVIVPKIHTTDASERKIWTLHSFIS